LELLAFMKLLTEVTTFPASLVTVAICEAEGLDESAETELLSVFTDDVIALVSVGKSLLAELTTFVASVWILASCDFRPLTPLLEFKLFSPLTELCRFCRLEQ